MFNVGELIGNRYEVVKLLGKQCGMSNGNCLVKYQNNVFFAKVLASNQSPSNGFDYDFLKNQLIREADILKELRHARIPRTVDHFDEIKGNDKYYVLVTDPVDGLNLEEMLLEGQSNGIKNFGEEKTIDWALEICDVLEYCHGENVIHRDIKPSNIILGKDSCLYLVDFGIARQVIHFGTRSLSTQALGSPEYCPLEQYSNEKPTQMFDIYALGATMYRLATGEEPITSADRVAKQSDFPPKNSLSPSLDSVVRKMVELFPKDRHQNISEVKQDLLKAKVSYSLASSPIQVMNASAPSRTVFDPHNTGYEIVNGSSYSDALHNLRAACLNDSKSSQPTINVNNKKMPRPLTFWETVKFMRDIYSVTGNARIFSVYMDTCTGIAYLANSTMFKIIPESENLISIPKGDSRPFLPIDYGRLNNFPEIDSSETYRGLPLFNCCLDKQRYMHNKGWYYALQQDTQLMSDFFNIISNIKGRNGELLSFYVKENPWQNLLRALFVSYVGDSFAGGGNDLGSSARFLRVAQK